jgi:hypothetical protein
MSATLESLSSIASGLEDTQPSIDEVPVRPTPPSVTGAAPPAETSGASEKGSWWEWAMHKADEVEAWVDEFVHKHTPGKDGKGKDGDEGA